MDENELESVVEVARGMRDENINISDVIEIIETDPDFRESSMFNGGCEISQVKNNINNNNSAQTTISAMPVQRRPYVRIGEQPASKALRFRYECEGRSAGSIPGASSTPENKTFPSIQIVGYQGRAVVVVSCVTKDDPYRPHPHNLVGREGCKKGVCTLEISPETMSVTFSNLGIQCVKKKDIENALRVRQEIRVDPYRTGFAHSNQPTSIDLNAVRLCFQVFLEGDKRGKFTVPLAPVVSDAIFDKKAMSDLIIVKLSDCVSYVDGGRKDIILLCEKVAKEDIQVRFYEEKEGIVVWEAFGDFQPSQVHKQTAIWFRAPRYRTLEVTEPVKIFIQLRRPSDGACSESLPFELLPLDSGRPPYWSFRRNLIKKGNYNLFNTLLTNDAKLVAKRQSGNLRVDLVEKTIADQPEKIAVANNTMLLNTEDDKMETNNNEFNVASKESDMWVDYSTSKIDKSKSNSNEEKSFNELIDQVAELDEIYSGTQKRLTNDTNLRKSSIDQLRNNECFDDSKTYSSLQMAFKNPVGIVYKTYEDVTIEPKSPIIDINANNNNINNKRENDVEKLPPLPPKRAKKIETYIGGSMESIQLPKKHPSISSLKPEPVTRSSPFMSKSQSELVPPGKRLPPTPFSTLPNPKKRGFLSKLFGRKTKTQDISREHSTTPTRNSFPSSNSLQINVLTRSSGNLSTHSSSSIRIPLKDSPTNSLKATPTGDADVKTSFDPSGEELAMNLDLTEAEHYALYTTMAPHATQSEFDEMSCYYAPVEGGKLLTNAEVIARLAT